MAKNPSALMLSATAGGHFWGKRHHKFFCPQITPLLCLNHATSFSHHAYSTSTSSKGFVSIFNEKSSPGRRRTPPGAQGFILGECSYQRRLGVPGGFQLLVRETTADPSSRGGNKQINSGVHDSPCFRAPKFVPEALHLCKGPSQCPIGLC